MITIKRGAGVAVYILVVVGLFNHLERHGYDLYIDGFVLGSLFAVLCVIIVDDLMKARTE